MASQVDVVGEQPPVEKLRPPTRQEVASSILNLILVMSADHAAIDRAARAHMNYDDFRETVGIGEPLYSLPVAAVNDFYRKASDNIGAMNEMLQVIGGIPINTVGVEKSPITGHLVEISFKPVDSAWALGIKSAPDTPAQLRTFGTISVIQSVSRGMVK